jgi:hypothetical protein
LNLVIAAVAALFQEFSDDNVSSFVSVGCCIRGQCRGSGLGVVLDVLACWELGGLGLDVMATGWKTSVDSAWF